jgi:hypothetical protein
MNLVVCALWNNPGLLPGGGSQTPIQSILYPIPPSALNFPKRLRVISLKTTVAAKRGRRGPVPWSQ